jgi:hypothetical protein
MMIAERLSMMDPMTDEAALPSWGNALATVAACGVIGAVVDFYIGRRGQERVRDWLETWWLRLSCVRWGNFGREEALFAVQVMDRLFGARLFSAKRITTALGIIFVFGGLWILQLMTAYPQFSFEWRSLFDTSNSLLIATTFVSLVTSISLTRFASARVALILARAPYLNLLGAILLLLFQYALLCYSPVFVFSTHLWIGAIIHGAVEHSLTKSDAFDWLLDVFKEMPQLTSLNLRKQIAMVAYLLTPDEWDMKVDLYVQHLSHLLAAVPCLARLVVAAIFTGLFFLQSLQHSIMTLWARVIESDKPVFTLVFGGTAAVGKAIQEISKAFW